MPERVLIENCSPTLAGMKPANLISLAYQDSEAAREDIREMNRIFVRKGLRAVPLNFCRGHVLLYLYRPEILNRRFSDGRIRAFLEGFGYDCRDADRCVARLGERIRTGKGKNFHMKSEFSSVIRWRMWKVLSGIRKKAASASASGGCTETKKRRGRSSGTIRAARRRICAPGRWEGVWSS